MATVRPRRRLIRPAAVLLAVLAGLAIGFGADVARNGGVGAWLARHGLPPPYIPQGQRYDIGERSLYLDCRGSGSPTVVLEAGSGSDSATWSAVHDAIAATTRTCAYDRAGRGRSDGRETHTLADAVADLRTPARRGRGAPAHSSSPATRSAGRMPGCSPRPTADEVVGALLVDSFEPDIQDDQHPPAPRRAPARVRGTARRPAGARLPRGRARLAGERGAAAGVVVRGYPARGAGCGPLRAAPGCRHERGDRRRVARWHGGAVAGPDDLHDRVRRRPQHPH